MRMSNRWNRLIYRLWAPVYDATVERIFRDGRRRAMALLAPRPGERVLLVGVGTGADLPLLPAGVTAIGTDLSEHMLRKARRKLAASPASIELVAGDAQTRLVADRSCDAAMLNLVLSVVPDARACLEASLDALKPGGRAVVFDKFQPDATRPSAGRRLANALSTVLGTDITRRLGDMTRGLEVEITHDEPVLMGGMYRVVMMRKAGARPQARGT